MNLSLKYLKHILQETIHMFHWLKSIGFLHVQILIQKFKHNAYQEIVSAFINKLKITIYLQIKNYILDV
jgi:hypothetical protein